uniref:AAA-family ATPase n=1 Tax=Burkholderia phage vB_BgluM-SURPRISE13 TaxID=3159457 RepID=A0AAU7PH45_9VIRU
MNWIVEVFRQYNAATQANPLLATMILPIVGGLMYFMKDVPKKVWDFIVSYSTVTMWLNNAGYDGNLDAYNMFDKWFMQSGYGRFSRSFFMFRQYRDDMFADETVYKPYRLGVGDGWHFFFYKRRFFWFNKGKLESGGSEKQKEEIMLRTFGWKQSAFQELVELFNTKKGGADDVFIHKFDATNKSWEQVGKVPLRDISTFCMNEDIKAEILNKITEFTNRRDWYRKKGLTYKESFLFLGPPGTGKTTLCKLLAAYFKKDLYVIDLTDHTNASLVDALAKIKPGSFVLMEDVDQAGNAVKDRNKKKELVDMVMDMNCLTMSGFLNAFDGVVGLDNIIVLMTTNRPDDLDSAVRRKSRINNEYLIDEIGTKEIWAYATLMYELDDKILQPHPGVLAFLNSDIRLPGCEVENAFKENPESLSDFLTEIAARGNERLKKAA